MAMSKQDILNWINTIPDNSEIGIDEGGLTLQVINDPEVYLEVGGIPEEDTYSEDNPHPTYPYEDYVYEICAGSTKLTYNDWVEHSITRDTK